MIRLATLGESALRRADGRSIASVLQQPRRFALLCYLAVADASLIRRDTLLGLFWPEKPEEDARHGLSQAIHYLRRQVGEDVIQGGGTEGFGIDPAALSCDARDFGAALKRGDAAEALRLYRGDFLPGFFLTGSLELEHWLEGFRGHLRRQAADAAWTLAQAEAEANPVSAAGIARRAVDLSLGDEAAVRRLLQLLDRTGDRAGALEAYEALRRKLAADYAAEPSAETMRIAASLTTASAVGNTPTVQMPDYALGHSAKVTEPHSSEVQGAREPARRHALHPAASATVTLLLIAGFVSLWGLSRGRAEEAMPTIVVEELRDYSSGHASDDLGGAVTTEVLAKLTGIVSMRAHAPDTSGPNGAYGAHHLLLRAGLIRSADSVRVTAVLLDGRSRVTLDRAFTVRSAEHSIALVDELATWLSAFARKATGEWVQERAWREKAPRGRALELIRSAVQARLAADSLRRGGATAAALAAFGTADELLAEAEQEAPEWSEPTIQRAETGLRLMWAHYLSSPPDRPRSREALATALRHAERAVAAGDPAALEIRAVLRHWLWFLAPTDSAALYAVLARAIEDDLKRTLERDPTRARAWYIRALMLQVRGRFGDAHFAAERAREADAFLEYVREVAGVLFSTALETNQPESARQWCDELKQLFPSGNTSAFCELNILAWFGTEGMHDVDRAWQVLSALPPEARAVAPWQGRHDILLGILLARAGATDSAAAMLRRGAEAPPDLDSGQLLAWGLVELGQIDSAAAVLERSVLPRFHSRAGILHSTRYRPLQTHPRIAPLIRATRTSH